MKTRKSVRIFGEDITNRPAVEDVALSQAHSGKSESRSHEGCIRLRGKRANQIAVTDALRQYESEILQFCFHYNHYSEGCQITNAKDQKNKELPYPLSSEITYQMRDVLLEWLLEVHLKLKLQYETLFLTVYLIDKYCQTKSIRRKHYQLLALSSLFIAGKYEEIVTLKLKKVAGLCDRFYSESDVLKMQGFIFLQLDFKISQPSLNWYISALLHRLKSPYTLKSPRTPSLETQQNYQKHCYFLTQLCLFEHTLLTLYQTHIIAIAILYTIAMESQFLNINIRPISDMLSAVELKSLRECSQAVKVIYSDRRSRIVCRKYCLGR